MKLKRDEFKAMLKECILELVQEGKLFNGMASPATGHPHAQTMTEQMDHSGEPSVTPNTRLNEAIRATVHQVSKGDPKKAGLYESIIADTARTTLQKQIFNDPELQGAGLAGANMGMGVLPEERAYDNAQLGMFSAKNRWAQLAFGGKAKIGNGS